MNPSKQPTFVDSSVLIALHLAAAISAGAEFISAERPTKPIYQAGNNISSIY